jgi:DUF1680 family protein
MKRVAFSTFVFILLILFACQKKDSVPFQKNNPVGFNKVTITDNFWLPRIKDHAKVTLPACIYQCEYKSQRIKNFAIAGKSDDGEYSGLFYDDSDLYKMLEGASYSLMNNPDAGLEAKLDSIISLISKAQMEDGYLDTYYQLNGIENRWSDMNMHEMYCCGHLIEAGIAYYNATGKRVLLDVGIQLANHIDRLFGEGKRTWVPGHQEIELALVKLYRITNEERYLTLAHWLLEQRGYNHADWKDKDYYQDLMPVKDLSKISGHAVRAMYMFTGMADVSAALEDTTYIPALDRLWDNVVCKNMYITGGIGSSYKNEGFTEDYDLPNEEAYCETCASVGMALWNQRMNMLKGDGKYIDVLERSVYNGALAGISLSADSFFYVNPLASSGHHHRKPWYGTACCPSQISRFLPSIGNYIYAVTSNSIVLNLFIQSETTVNVNSTEVQVKQTTDYPWDGVVKIGVSPQKEKNFRLQIRKPEWCKSYSVKINGIAQETKEEIQSQYLIIERKWNKGDEVIFNMDMPVEMVKADPRVKANAGKCAIQRGPLVYCMEEIDNPDFDIIKISSNTKFTSRFVPDLLKGIVSITAQDGDNTISFIPYYAWDNRESGKMKVWVECAD